MPGEVKNQPQKPAFHQDRLFRYHRELRLTRLQYLNNMQYLWISQPRLSVTYTIETSWTFSHFLLGESTSSGKVAILLLISLHGVYKKAPQDQSVPWAVPGQRNHRQRQQSTNFKFGSSEITAQMFHWLVYTYMRQDRHMECMGMKHDKHYYCISQTSRWQLHAEVHVVDSPLGRLFFQKCPNTLRKTIQQDLYVCIYIS